MGAPINEDEINNHHFGKVTFDLLEQLDERGLDLMDGVKVKVPAYVKRVAG